MISSSEIVVDTVPAPAQAMRPDALRDTIAIVLRALQDSVTSERLYIYDEAWREGLRLRYSNDLINAKIYRLIMDFEEEETDYLMRRIDENEAIRSRSSRMLGWVAAGAVVLMLLFVAVLWRDINRSNRPPPSSAPTATTKRVADAGHYARHQGAAGFQSWVTSILAS